MVEAEGYQAGTPWEIYVPDGQPQHVYWSQVLGLTTCVPSEVELEGDVSSHACTPTRPHAACLRTPTRAHAGCLRACQLTSLPAITHAQEPEVVQGGQPHSAEWDRLQLLLHNWNETCDVGAWSMATNMPKKNPKPKMAGTSRMPTWLGLSKSKLLGPPETHNGWDFLKSNLLGVPETHLWDSPDSK